MNSKERVRYRFPKHETIDQLEIVFIFDLETDKDQDFAEASAAGLYDVNRLREKWNRDLIPDETVIEKVNVFVFDGFNENHIIKMLKQISENYEADEGTYIDKEWYEIVSSYRLLLLAHTSSGFDSWVVLNSLVKKITDSEYLKIARGLISLSFRCGIKIVNTCDVPQYVNTLNLHVKKLIKSVPQKKMERIRTSIRTFQRRN